MTLTLALVVGNAALCAGWAATPEARMACCAKEAECPMHKSGSSDADGHHVVTQAQADSCCALSERSAPSPSTPTFAVTIPSAVLTVATVLSAETPALVLGEPWRTRAPLRADPGPKHVLLSVFLV